MIPILNTFLVFLLALNLFALGTSRILTVIRIVALQGAILGLLPLMIHTHLDWLVILLTFVTVVMKGGLIPWMLLRAMRDVQIKREMEPLIGFMSSMILGAMGLGLALGVSSFLPLANEHTTPLIVPAGLATSLTGFILLIARYKAITQVIGYLVLENGIFIFGLLLVDSMPLLVELGILLDLFVAIFVICIVVNHINRAFASLDTRQLVNLKE